MQKIKKYLERINWRNFVFSYFLSFFISFTLVIGALLEFFLTVPNWKMSIFFIVILAILLYPITSFMLNKTWQSKNKKIQFLAKALTEKRALLLLITIHAVFFLLVFPGVYGYDAGYQIMEFSGLGIQPTQSYSVLQSFLLSWFVNSGKTLFNSSAIGLAIYIVLQMAFGIFVEYKIFKSLKEGGKNILALLAFCVFISPITLIMMSSTSQDVWLAIFGILFFLELLKLERVKNQKVTKRELIKMALLSFLVCASRNTGIFLIIAVTIALLFKKNWKTAVILCVSILLFLTYTNILDGIGVKKINRIGEVMSVPAQQMTRCMVSKHEVFEDSVEKEYYEYFPNIDISIYNYNQRISDYQKNKFNGELFKNNPYGFFKLYITMSKNCEKEYVEAFLQNSMGYWYIMKNYPDRQMYHPVIEYDMLEAKKWNQNYENIDRYSLFPSINNELSKTMKDGIFWKIPVLNLLFSMGSVFIIFIATVVKILYTKNLRKYLVPISLITVQYMILFVSPVTLFRYQFMVWLLIPLIIKIFCEIKIDSTH